MELEGNIPGNNRNAMLVPLIDETIHALENMADLKGTSDLLSYHVALDVFEFKDFAVCIPAKNASGGGKIIMNFGLDTALAIGNKVRAKMLGTDENATALNDEVREALAEFSNTIIGLATRHFNSASEKISIGTPLYLYEKEDSEFLLQGVKQIMTVPIDIQDVGRFYFSYLRN